MEHKRRRKITAVLTNFFFPGLGVLYAGYPRRAIVLMLASFLLAFVQEVMIVLGPAFMIIAIVLIVGFEIFMGIDGFVQAKKTNLAKKPLTRYNRWYFYLLFMIALVAIPFPYSKSVGETFKGSSTSMAPTVLLGDHIVVQKSFFNIERGDVVIFKSPENGSAKPYLKRVIGMPGDVIEISDKPSLSINGKAVELTNRESYRYEDYKQTIQDGYLFSERIGEKKHKVLYDKDRMLLVQDKTFQVPEESYFMLGDNRDNSNDSRFFGPVKKEEIMGKARYIHWPLARFGQNL